MGTFNRIHLSRLRVTIARTSIALGIAVLPGLALAQETGNEAPARDKEIIVTGTQIRGVAPAASESLSIDQGQIAATGASSTSQLLASVPQAASFNTRPIVSAGGSTQLTINRPNLRNLPGTSGGGSSTLVLLDGHRLPGMGIRQTVPDPDAIAPGAIERVEIVLDGGSSIYGADAVGGVINFISRKRFDGVEARGRYGFGDEYQTADVDITAGKAWDTASAYISYNYAWHDSLFGRDRDYVKRLDHTTGQPFDLTCNPGNAVIGSSLYGLPNMSLGSANRCDISDNRTFYPSEARHSVFAGVSLGSGGPVTFDVRGFYTHRVNKGDGGPITATTTIAPVNPFTMASNPFYRNTGDANSFRPQSINFDFSPVLGDHSSQYVRMETWGFAPSMTADLGAGWQLRFLANYGVGTSTVRNDKVDDGTLSGLVLSGNFNPYNLLDPANQAVLPLVTDFLDYGRGRNELINTRAVVDGSLFTLPGGDLKIAVGGEYIREKYLSEIDGTVAASAVSALPTNRAARTVAAVFGELSLPIIGEGNRSGGLYALNVSASGRYDDYSDFGGTFNPKFGLTYRPVDWVKLSGTWGTSFQAPSLSDGADAAPATIFAFPLILFQNPGVAPVPGQAQIFLGGGGVDLKPQESTTWSLGLEIEPPVDDGLKLNFNYYNIDFKNLIDIPPVFNPSVFYTLFTDRYVMNPTVDQVNALASQVPGGLGQVAPFTVVPGQVYSIADGRRTNLASVKTDGFDFGVYYDGPTDFGSIYGSVSGNYVLNRKEQAVSGAPVVSTVNDYARFRVATTVGAVVGNLRAQATFNHLSGYDVAALPSNLGQERVGSFNVVNLFFDYGFKSGGLLEDLSLTLNVDNLFDTDPPIYRGTLNNLDGYGVTSIGRVITFGVNKKF